MACAGGDAVAAISNRQGVRHRSVEQLGEYTVMDLREQEYEHNRWDCAIQGK